MPNKNYGVPYRELVENSAYGFKLKGDRYYGPNGWYFNADKYKNNPDTKAQWPILESPDTTEQSSIADEELTIANEINNPKSDIELAMEYRERNPYFSAAPMDNTVVNFGKSELFPHGRTTKVYTPDEIDAMLGYKPKPSTIDKILMGAFSLPVAYMVTAGGIVPTISSMVTNPVSWTLSTAGGYAAKKVSNSAVNYFSDGKYLSFGDMMGSNDTEKFILDLFDPLTLASASKLWNIGLGIEKRGAEVLMRTTQVGDPTQDIINGIKHSSKDRKAAVANYILFNKKHETLPYNNLAARLVSKYSGIFHADDLPTNEDLISAYLYGTPLNDEIGTLVSKGSNFGVHENYIKSAYPNKANKIPVYEINVPNTGVEVCLAGEPVDWLLPTVTLSGKPVVGNIKPTGKVLGGYGDIEVANGMRYDAGGHQLVLGIDDNGLIYWMLLDIWKFKPSAYMNKWIKPHTFATDLLKRYGLHFIDSHGTPVVARTPWRLQLEEPNMDLLKQTLPSKPKFR